jgi:hypothetical protein
VEFTETYTRDAKLGVSAYGLSASAVKGSQFARTPLNEIDVVRELRGMVKTVADDGWQVVVAIDELDKMHDPDEAVAFLNQVKVLFPIHDCSFIVSVSEDAWASFENRGLPFRDTFDSSFDEIIFVEMLTPLESRDFLKRRASSITDAQTLLCHCLAGGLPRDLLRAARLLAHVADKVREGDDSESVSLDQVLSVLLLQDIQGKLRASGFRARDRGWNGPSGKLAWPEIWTDITKTERRLAEVGSTYSNGGKAGLPSQGCPEPGTGRDGTEYIDAYIAVLHTIRQAFAPGGALTLLGKTSDLHPQLLEGFHCVAGARWYLASDVAAAWQLLQEGRTKLGLPPLESRSPRPTDGDQ